MTLRLTEGSWPYPLWIAHRGAGKLAPENTLAAFRTGASYGYRMFECDVKLSADDVPFLLHDATLQRTCNGKTIQGLHSGAETSAIAGDHSWQTLSQLDAGSWHSRAFAGEPLPTLSAVAAYCLGNSHFLNIEIKPTPGTDRHTGEVIARNVALLWRGQSVPPLLTSFSTEALEGAKAGQAELPRGLLLDSLWTGWLETALMLGCVAVVCHQNLWDSATMTQAKAAGLRTLSYTINDEWAAQRLLALGIDGIITDRVELFPP